MNSIIKAVARTQHLKPRDLTGHDKHKNIVLARDMAIYIILQRDGLTFTEVGKAFNRTPATASYAYQKIARNMHSNPSFRKRMLRLLAGLDKDNISMLIIV